MIFELLVTILLTTTVSLHESLNSRITYIKPDNVKVKYEIPINKESETEILGIVKRK